MYNLLEYSSNYSGTTGILWFYSKNEATNFSPDITYNNDNNLKSFNYKAKLLPNTVTQPSPNNNDGTLKHEQLPYHESIYVIFDDHLKRS